MSEHPERPTVDGRHGSADPARPEPPVGEPPDTAEQRRPEPSLANEPVAPPGAPHTATAGDRLDLSERADEPDAQAPLREPVPTAAPVREPGYRGLALGLAVALVLVLALVGTAPFWAPLLPWDGGRTAIDPTIMERLDAAQQQIGKLQQQIAAAVAVSPQVEQRIGALERKPAPPPPDLGEIRRQIAVASGGIADLANRLDSLESSVKAQAAEAGDLKTGLDRLDKSVQAQAAGLSDLTSRLDRTEKAQQAQAADLAAKLAPLQQGLQAQQSASTALQNHLHALEKTVRSRAGDATDTGLALALLQIRNAIETGRPFAAEYSALSSLAKARPEIAAAAAPLAAAAPTGIADRADLEEGLRTLAKTIEAAPAGPSAGDGWTGAALARLRGLVTIRRAEKAAPAEEAAAAITVAEQALAGGDLTRATAAIETLQGPAAASAAGWLQKARERLAVEAALRRLEALLTARLGDAAAMPGAPG